MLEKYDIEVDMADAAERAIEYLQSNRPDAIFMDHQMPGMDGLQALKTIKGNPQTAMIPIMMYTSQEGELYVGQARALGAMGVLPKQVRPVDVSKVLYELHLLPDRREMTEPALAPVELVGGKPVEVLTSKIVPAAAGIDWGRRVETAVKDQTVDLRRFIVASLDSFASRIVSDVRDTAPPPPAEPLIAQPQKKRAEAPAWLAVGAACLLAAGFAAGWVMTRNELADVRAQLAGLSASNAELQRARTDLAATVRDLTAAVAGATGGVVDSAAGALPPPPPGALRVEPVPYGEIPFDRSRLDVLRDFLAKLEAQGFHGVVRITSAAGMFCLTGNATDGFAPAAASLPLSKCDLIGNPFEDSLSSQQRQSLAFANLIAGVRQRAGGAISIDMESGVSPRNNVPYPVRTEGLTAGEWNRAAAANNRVEFAAESSGAGP
jgi:CheY-like chemotaxis protein